ncbi:hypothetical protein PR048_019020 [Dryococelus australis]|uniref:Uncharacterized protein n=1 Tax=Dryococelus australis TaxID=614101 RepID=A0ABQ9H2F2_9NEOP|nr:hypothetical protein PR048_019020 [Dryococelus australis]
MRVIEVSMGQRRNERPGETGDPRENTPTNGIYQDDSHMRKYGVTRPGIESAAPWWEARREIRRVEKKNLNSLFECAEECIKVKEYVYLYVENYLGAVVVSPDNAIPLGEFNSSLIYPNPNGQEWSAEIWVALVIEVLRADERDIGSQDLVRSRAAHIYSLTHCNEILALKTSSGQEPPISILSLTVRRYWLSRPRAIGSQDLVRSRAAPIYSLTHYKKILALKTSSGQEPPISILSLTIRRYWLSRPRPAIVKEHTNLPTLIQTFFPVPPAPVRRPSSLTRWSFLPTRPRLHLPHDRAPAARSQEAGATLWGPVDWNHHAPPTRFPWTGTPFSPLLSPWVGTPSLPLLAAHTRTQISATAAVHRPGGGVVVEGREGSQEMFGQNRPRPSSGQPRREGRPAARDVTGAALPRARAAQATAASPAHASSSLTWLASHAMCLPARSLPANCKRRAGFDSRQGSLLDFLTWKSWPTMSLVGGFFLGELQFLPSLPFRRSSTLFSSRDPDVGRHPHLSSPLKYQLQCRTIALVGGFSRGSPVSPAPSFRRRSIFTSITHIGPQDLAVKSRPNLFTHSLFTLYSKCNVEDFED